MPALLCMTVVAAMIAGCRLPAAAGLAGCIPYGIGLMLFLNFLDLRVRWRRCDPWALAAALLLPALVMPLVAHHLLSRGLTPPFRTGVLLVALAPTGITALVLGRYVRGGSPEALMGVFLVTTAASMLYIPLVLQLVRGAGVHLAHPPLTLAAQLAVLVIVPWIAGRAVGRRLAPAQLAVAAAVTRAATPVLVFGVVAVSIAQASGRLPAGGQSLRLALAVGAVYLVAGILGYLIGYLRRDEALKATLPVACSSRNIQLVLAVSVLNFDPLTSVPVVVAIFFHHLANAFWIWALGRRPPPRRPGTEAPGRPRGTG